MDNKNMRNLLVEQIAHIFSVHVYSFRYSLQASLDLLDVVGEVIGNEVFDEPG